MLQVLGRKKAMSNLGLEQNRWRFQNLHESFSLAWTDDFGGNRLYSGVLVSLRALKMFLFSKKCYGIIVNY